MKRPAIFRAGFPGGPLRFYCACDCKCGVGHDYSHISPRSPFFPLGISFPDPRPLALQPRAPKASSKTAVGHREHRRDHERNNSQEHTKNTADRRGAIHHTPRHARLPPATAHARAAARGRRMAHLGCNCLDRPIGRPIDRPIGQGPLSARRKAIDQNPFLFIFIQICSTSPFCVPRP